MAPSPDDRLADMLTRSAQHGWAPSTSLASRDRPLRHRWPLSPPADVTAQAEAEDDDAADEDTADDAEILALLPGNRPIPRRWIIMAIVVITVVGIAGFVLLRNPTAPEPSTGVEPPTAQPQSPDGAGESSAADAPVQVSADAEEVTAHVVGAVAEPGVVRLQGGARVIDAIEAAGGLSPDAQPEGVNLARLVEDGEQIIVPDRHSPPAAQHHEAGGQDAGQSAGTGAGSDPAGPQANAKVNINRATAAELETLPGVGPATAQAIITHREEHGPFGSVEDLVLVHGIGDATLARLREHITVG
ncbi:ComEA family DNA-binding protein [Brevibacterium luteolum]|uniref:helix-hairpin-helix domain-containing protein n=1 Tax=Brevibacterium luteolum TaxID=199591 RepID=UPI0015850F1B|nr:ComEA family DNA-binding protein [Brevibacterium luteolum]